MAYSGIYTTLQKLFDLTTITLYVNGDNTNNFVANFLLYSIIIVMYVRN